MRRLTAIALLVTPFGVLAADEPGPLITDSTGKELTLKRWKITGGTRMLSWLEGKPEAFEVREVGSTNFKDGIVTLVLMSRVENIVWDYEKETMTVHVAGLEKPLVGSTKFRDINTLSFEADVDQGKSGVASLRFRGGLAKGGIRGVKFSNAKAPPGAKPASGGFAFTVPPEAKSKAAPAVHSANGVQALYRLAPGNEKPLSYLMFKKTLQVELADIKELTVGTYNAKDRTAECELKQKDGSELSVTLLGTIQIDGKPATLEGLIGEVPAGYRLFPIHTVSKFEPAK
jgi:hypothetical protein